MADISRVALFGKLNGLCYQAIEAATTFCKLRGNPYVELIHWYHQILQLQDSDLHRILRAFDIDAAVLARDMTAALDRLPRGATAISDLSAHVEDATERGWVLATLMFGVGQVRSGHLLLGCLKTTGLRNAVLAMSKEFGRIRPEKLGDEFDRIVGGSAEEPLGAHDGSNLAAAAEAGDGAIAPAQIGKQQALQRFTVDLTEKARKNELDPIVGRDEEIRQVVDILMRRRQNNPILTGEAGVGKTAVVEGFALRIAAGDVPPPMKDLRLLVLDVGLLQAGASMKGEFEQRLRSVIDEVQSSPKPIILFIDEAHTLIGAGGTAGTGDAANLLKPALARGTLRTIAATTWAEYKKHIEKDPALTRRFQVVQIDEPTEAKAILMMRGLASILEKHHRVQILDEALEAAVRLSRRYIPARQLPDKSVSLLDTACARVAISQQAVPAEVEDSRRRVEALETELQIIAREKAIGIPADARDKDARQSLAAERDRLGGLEARWSNERGLVDRLLRTRAELRGEGGTVEDASAPDGSPRGREQLLARLRELQGELAALQGETPLILPTVDQQAIATVVQDWTGIPVGRMVKDEIQTVLGLAELLNRRVVGQDHAMKMIARRIETSRAGIDNPGKPVGVFMLCGPSGVGKTETALALAELLYGGEHNVITINMSEFQEPHTVSTLKGAPPGYVGYGEGGILTEAVRRKPYSVVLLDEVEKAHSDVHELFFQVFDKGMMEDGEGRLIDFKNTLILLTSNVGSDLIVNLCKDPELLPDVEGLASALRQPLRKVFPAALLGRLIVIPYYPLSPRMIENIVGLQLDRIRTRIEETRKVSVTYDQSVVSLVASRCTETESGGRMIDAILTNTMLPAISRELLIRMMSGQPVKRLHLSAAKGDFQYDFDGGGTVP
ncbi:MAG TPA: type VI secretion system ATPase TssH [Stellaceae bacterium]|nr:type VI secretion system ATPase TssH [Stellaceae bacterium]